MGLLGGMIAAGAAAGAGEAVLREHERSAREEMEKRLVEHRAAVEDNYRQAAEQREMENRKQERSDIFDETLLRAPQLAQLEVDKQRKLGELKNAQDLDALKQQGPEKIRQAVEQQTKTLEAMSTPEALKSERLIAQAKHIVDPAYQLVPLSDGTIGTFDARTGKTSGVLTGPDGQPLVRKDTAEMTAAVESLRYANNAIRVAEIKYKTDLASVKDVTVDPKEKERVTKTAEEEFAASKLEAQTLAASALAVLGRKMKTPAGKPSSGMLDTPPESYPGGGSATARPPLSSFGGKK